jgi:hypothetical protein
MQNIKQSQYCNILYKEIVRQSKADRQAEMKRDEASRFGVGVNIP